jgi:predicted Zn-dependent peptidase
MRRHLLLGALLVCLSPVLPAVLPTAVLGLQVAHAQDLASFEKRTTVKTLGNGLTVIIVERPEAPVFSYFTHVDVGGAQEAMGQTGLAHMFEHMAFKGTDKIGTKNFAVEKGLVEKVEKAYLSYDAERRRPQGSDPKKVESLEKAWRDAIAEASKQVAANEFGEIVDRNGGVGLNAFTNSDETGYFYSLPSNRLELWAYLESERGKRPIMREFYTERDVVNEERRMRTDSRPVGRMLEQLLAAAFTAHPYGRPVVGWPSDLNTWSATDALKFWETYYTPANMAIAIVGDVKATETLPVLEAYFGRLPKGPKPAPLSTVEPKQFAERMVILREVSQPWYAEGYHRPDVFDKDDAVYDAIADLMSTGRTARLYRSLVRDKKLAAAAGGFSGLPGRKYPHLFAFYAMPSQGNTPQQVRSAIHDELERLKNSLVSEEELTMVRARAKMRLLNSLSSNQALAISMATAQQRFGDWREVFRRVERIDKVSKEDIMRVARAVFIESNRTAVWIESTAQGGK